MNTHVVDPVPPLEAESIALNIGRLERVLRASLTPLRVSSTDHNFTAEVRVHSLGEIKLITLDAPAFVLERGEVERQSPHTRSYGLLLQRSGSVSIAQAGRVVRVNPAELVAFDLAGLFRIEAEGDVELAVYVVPQGVVDLPPYMINDYVAAKVLNSDPFAKPVDAFLAELARQMPVDAGLEARYASAAGNLIETLFRLHVDNDHALHTSKIAKFERIVEYLETHLLDSDLTPSSVADAHFMSTRYLQEIFQMHGMTVTSWVRHRRLEQCRQALRDPRNASRSVASIAAEWGFSDSPYFSRAFRREFGVSPSSLR